MLLFLALGVAALWNETRREARSIEREVDAAVGLFELQLAGDIDTMRIAMDPMLEDPVILERFMAGDREGLFDLVEGRFRALREEHGVSHMYFVGPDRVSFLRVHQPDNYGEVIERFTMREAQRTGGLSSGLELGILGIPSLRVVSPLRHEGRVVGYFELGREIDEYAGDIRRTLGINLHVMIDKGLIDEEDWARGQALLGRDADWTRFGRFVAAGTADGSEDEGEDEGEDEMLEQVMPQVSESESDPVRVRGANNQHFAIGAHPLLDASDDTIGLLVVKLDVSTAVRTFRRALLGFLTVFIVFAAVMVTILHGVVGRAEQRFERAEAVEREVMSQLEERVRERTRRLNREISEREAAEGKLRQAQKMEVIGQLTGGVAHDFNNLLAIIIGDLEAAREEVSEELFEDLLGGAWEASERGADLVSRLLAVSRRQSLSPRDVDSNQLIADLMPLLRRAIPRYVRIETECEAELSPCFADPSQLENLILNLVINARDAIPNGGTVTIATRARTITQSEAGVWQIEAGDYVELSVSDTGTGMSPEVLAKAMDPFFTTKEIGKGSGLGLAMAHGTASQSGGRLELHSELGVGTTVRLLLPQTPSSFENNAPAPQSKLG